MTDTGLTVRTLTAADDSALLDGWLNAVQRGFHGARADDLGRAMWRAHITEDDAVMTGAWLTDPPLDDSRIPVATFCAFDKTINPGLGPVGLHMITDVTVAPTHRRQGLLRRLMTDDLADATGRGVPLAALTVSEGSIYGRFGFGSATAVRHVEVDPAKFALRAPAAAGAMVMMEPEPAWPTMSAIFEEFHRTTPGSVERPHFYAWMMTGRFQDWGKGPDHELRVAVHVAPDGRPDGYVVYRPVEPEGGRTGGVRIRDLVALTPAVYLRLWQFLTELDLVGWVSTTRSPIDDPLPWALVDPRAVRTTQLEDLLWVRVLDLAAALTARPWWAEDDLVLAVDDPLGHTSGRWRVVTRSGRAEVTASEAGPDVTLPADTLGALYLGGIDVRTLAAAGRLHGAPEAVGRFAAMADGGPAPYCITGF